MWKENLEKRLCKHICINEVIPYLTKHKDIVKEKNPRQSERWVLMEHNKTFMTWFKEQIIKDLFASETLTWLANGLKFDVLCCSVYEINGTLFYTKSQNDKSTVQNSRVTLEAESLQFSTSKDKKSYCGIHAILRCRTRDLGTLLYQVFYTYFQMQMG